MLEQSRNSLGLYGNVQFIFDDRVECDYVVVLNKIAEEKKVFCNPNNVWALMLEPSINGFFDFTWHGHEQFGKVFTSRKVSKSSKYITSHIMGGWLTGRTYDDIFNHKVGGKEKIISCISSNKSFLPGHKKRIEFINKLKSADLGIDFYGRDSIPLVQKWPGLYPYKFSLAIENSSSPDYWTEKISDCFMAYTIPIYYGCTNIDAYFPKGSFIKIDINDIPGTIKKIKEAISGDYYENNFNALIEARNLYLSRYHFFPCIANHINEDQRKRKQETTHSTPISLLPYRQPFLRKIFNIAMSQVRKFNH